MPDEFDWFSIEPSDGEFFVYGHGTYGEDSVLEGYPRKAFIDAFKTLAEAQAAYPDASIGATPKLGDPGPIAPPWHDAEEHEPWNPD